MEGQRKRGRDAEQAERAGPAMQDADPGAGPSNRSRDPEVTKMNHKIQEYERAAADQRTGSIPQATLDAATASVVRHMLLRHGEAPNQPVPHDRLTQLIGSSFKHGTKGHVHSAILVHAQAQMARVFGLEMECVVVKAEGGGRGAASKQPADSAGRKFYVVKSLLPGSYRDMLAEQQEPALSPSECALLYAVVGTLKKSSDGASMSEEELWGELRLLGVQRDYPHPELGKAQDALDNLCKQKFLKVVKRQVVGGGQETFIKIGEHAVSHFAEQELVADMKQYIETRQEEP